jgi:hypothetical protein
METDRRIVSNYNSEQPQSGLTLSSGKMLAKTSWKNHALKGVVRKNRTPILHATVAEG